VTLDAALRASELLLGLALMQQSAEHLAGLSVDRPLFLVRGALGAALAAGVAPAPVEAALIAVALVLLRRFGGPYNGGSDRMTLLILLAVGACRVAPQAAWREVAFAYLAVQLTLSYASAGWVKLANPEWRRGHALRDVFAFSVYPVSESLRGWADRPALLLGVSWGLMLLEVLFPLALLDGGLLRGVLVMALGFHLANACVFGLNRFVWTWVAGYPSLLWFHQRFFA
jgi:hypothetical protein